MVRFKSWRDTYLFLKNYGNFTCLNCKYGKHNLDLSIEHSDMDYASLFCRKTISMVRLDFQFCCDKWEDNETGEVITDFDGNCDVWKIPNDLLEILDDESKEWSIEEIEGVLKDYEGSVEEKNQ